MKDKINIEFTTKELNIIYNTIFNSLTDIFKKQLYCVTFTELENYYLLLKKIKETLKENENKL